MYISSLRYQIKLHLYVFLPACAIQKAKFQLVSNCCQRVLESSKLTYANKARNSVIFRHMYSMKLAKLKIILPRNVIWPLFNYFSGPFCIKFFISMNHLTLCLLSLLGKVLSLDIFYSICL